MPNEILNRSSPKIDYVDSIGKGRAYLEELRDNLLQQANTLSIAIEGMQESPMAPELPRVSPGQYAGMGISAALEAYLKARPGKRIPIKQVVEDLLAGGAVLGAKPKRYVQNVKITVRSRPKLVEWDEGWNVCLAPTAHEPKPPRRNKK